LAVDAQATTPRDGRIVWFVPTDLELMDIDAHGRVLLTGNELSGPLRGATAGEPRDRDLGWNGWSLVGAVSRDGASMLASMINTDDPNYTVLIRPMNGAVPVQIGSGRAQAISPDGKWALSITPSAPQRVLLLPTRAGESRQIDVGDLSPTIGVFVPGV